MFSIFFNINDGEISVFSKIICDLLWREALDFNVFWGDPTNYGSSD